MAQPMRSVAAQVMLSVEQGQSLSQCLPPALNRLPENERPALQALCFGVDGDSVTEVEAVRQVVAMQAYLGAHGHPAPAFQRF